MSTTGKEQTFQRNMGLFAFLLSGIRAINSGVVVNTLWEIYGSAYDMTGTLLSLMNIGNLLTGFTSDVLSAKVDAKKTVMLLAAGHGAGYMIMGFSGWMLVLMLGLFMVGVVKGSTTNTCIILMAGNPGDRTKGMNIMYGCYVPSTLLCPFFIAATTEAGNATPMLVSTACGFLLWLIFYVTLVEIKATKKDWNINKSFLKSRKFWMLTGLLFCQSAAETSITGWMVTYLKGNDIISGSLSPYTVTVMWRAALVARLLIVFVTPVKNSYSAMIKMNIDCIVFYMDPMMASTQTTAILLLFAFALTTAGMDPTAMASAGRITSTTSMGIMLSAASSGTIITSWIIGMVSEHAGIEIEMASNIVPCAGMLSFSTATKRLKEQEL